MRPHHVMSAGEERHVHVAQTFVCHFAVWPRLWTNSPARWRDRAAFSARVVSLGLLQMKDLHTKKKGSEKVTLCA